jgi:hypothetical protein
VTSAPEVIRKRDPAMTPWVEKYRPATIDDVAHQDQVCTTLKNALTTGNVTASSPASRLFARFVLPGIACRG